MIFNVLVDLIIADKASDLSLKDGSGDVGVSLLSETQRSGLLLSYIAYVLSPYIYSPSVFMLHKLGIGQYTFSCCLVFVSKTNARVWSAAAGLH